jgi:trehalose-phosphatase
MLNFWGNKENLEGLLKKNKTTLLFLDFDGTLAPFAPIPTSASLPRKTGLVLEKLVKIRSLSIIIISGRTLNDLKDKINLTGLNYSGSHGSEWVINKESFSAEISSETTQILQDIKRDMELICTEFEGALVERKIFSVVAHYRRVRQDRKKDLKWALQNTMAKYLDTGLVSLIWDKEAYELRTETGWTKGVLAKKLLPNGEECIFIGDSETDEEAFRQLPDSLTIRVGFSENSSAKYFLRDVQDVHKFLIWLLSAYQSKKLLKGSGSNNNQKYPNSI